MAVGIVKEASELGMLALPSRRSKSHAGSRKVVRRAPTGTVFGTVAAPGPEADKAPETPMEPQAASEAALGARPEAG
jgi:hypothetical protein